MSQRNLFSDIVKLDGIFLRAFMFVWERIPAADQEIICTRLTSVSVVEGRVGYEHWGICASGSNIFLSPTLARQEFSLIASTIAHELAHVWQWAVEDSCIREITKDSQWRTEADAELLVARWGCGHWEGPEEVMDDEELDVPFLTRLLIKEAVERHQSQENSGQEADRI